MSFFSPSRGGARGGKDQFKWEDVKGDKYREFYLGQTTMTKPVWWTSAITQMQGVKGGPAPPSAAQAEREALKKQEQEALREALGLAPPSLRGSTKSLEKHEMDELFKKGTTEHDMYTSESRVAGLGYAPAPTHRDNLPAGLQTLPGSVDGKLLSSMVHIDNQQTEEEDRPRKEKKDKDKKDKKDKEKKERKKEKKDKKDKKEKRDKRDKKDKSSHHRHDKDKHRGDRHKDEKDRERRHRKERQQRDDRDITREKRRHESR